MELSHKDDDSERDYQQIYHAPTVDTLGDASFYTTTAKFDHSVKLEKKSRRQKDKEFQIPQDSMAVSVRKVAISQRSAFGTRRPPSIPEQQSREISPSSAHLEWIETLQKVTHTRQLAFSPSVGRAADVLAPFSENIKTRDGRYRPIHPVQATLDDLPSKPPLLSNNKHRLPLRTDVGFPNPLPIEIVKKQQEIANETEWEEASPRLIVLVTSDDLGSSALSESIPTVGPELLMQKEINNRHFKRPSSSFQLQDSTANRTRYSMLAPPLDATHSRTLGWRPRPFHDRPPERVYTCVCPLQVKLESSVQEPFLCSLALYTLDGQASGKASEEYYFPAGDWQGKINQLKRKAIFSHDPLLIPKRDLYVVLQLFKVSHIDAAAAYLGKGSSKFFSKGSEDIMEKTTQRAKATFDSFGTQFLSPLCFGISALYPTDEERIVWPQGHTHQNMQLYAFPEIPESSTDFLQRLKHVAEKNDNWASFDNVEVPEVSSKVSEESSSLLSTTSSKKKKLSMRRILSGKSLSSKQKDMIPKHVDGQDSVVEAEAIQETPRIAAHVFLFVSSLETDFLQSMLFTPPELVDGQNFLSSTKAPPQVLVDASGESAILVDPQKSAPPNPLPGHVRKRSDLVRVPCRSHLLPNCQQREVLAMPPLSSKKEYDIPPSYRSLFNFLYLYPKALKVSSGVVGTPPRHYTVRIRLLVAVQEDGESRTLPLESFHNPAPWAGPAYLKSVYTKILSGPHDLQKNPMHLKDEFKLKLPMILDGSFVLHFSLFALLMEDSAESSISTHPLAETTIPLTSLSKEGNRIAIPNGTHRLKLGNQFVLSLETRLISSVHVPDAATAEALSSGIPRPLHDANGSVLAGHFPPLLWMHLSQLVQRNSEEKKLMETTMSFLQILSSIKTSFTSSGANGKARFQAFAKGAIDTFDEASLGSSKFSPDEVEDDAMSELHFEAAHPDVTTDEPAIATLSHVDDEEEEDGLDGGAVRKRKPLDLEIRITRTFSDIKDKTMTPFSRVAYGASKTDRMRLEAELTAASSFYQGDNKSYMVDDDETVVTAETRMLDAREAFDKTKQKFASGVSASKSFASETPSPLSRQEPYPPKEGTRNLSDFSSYARTLGELGVTLPQRARTAAQVMLAPCVAGAPGGLQSNLASLFSEKISPHFANASSDHQSGDKDGVMNLEGDKENPTEVIDQVLYSPGSDVEEDGADDVVSHSGESSYYTSEGTFRSPWHCQVLCFSIKTSPQSNLPVGTGDFIYESLLVLWLRAWARQVPTRNHPVGKNISRLPYSSMIPSLGKDPTYKLFYDQLDVLIPLCLKSIVLRYVKAIKDPTSRIARVIVDQGHMNVLELFVEMIALSLMGHGMQDIGKIRTENDEYAGTGSDDSLSAALATSEHLLDFLVGLCAVFHPAHMDVLIRKFFDVLRQCDEFAEQTVGNKKKESTPFAWSDETLLRAKCSRRLRLRAVEKLAVMPNFIALNYPRRLLGGETSRKPKKTSWTMQYNEANIANLGSSGDYLNSADELLPKSGWLAELLAEECLSICAHSCEAIVAESMAQEDASINQKNLTSLDRHDLLMFQSIAIHAITALHELLLRRHAMDRRFQRETSRGRIAALFTKPIFEKSLASVRWLARLESTHKVRSLWLLCFAYILQEAPENLIRQAVRSYADPKNLRIHRFVRLLRLGSSSFQSFIDYSRHCAFPSEIDSAISPWLLQESFNTICATIIIVVEECTTPLTTFPQEQKTIVMGILDLLLHVLTTPQSCVTHLRAVGGAIQALESFGIDIFVEVSGVSLQHWIRVILSLMNSTALSARSIAVDFVVSLIGLTFDSLGNIDELALIFATVLPEVAAREIALHSVSGHIHDLEDAEKAVWPLRRSFADIEEANPLDDDRVDPQLSPVLSVFCRACQAVIDGVLIEMRLQGKNCNIAGEQMKVHPPEKYTFDADEESLFEAACFFIPETAPMQRIRWLLTLKSLHEAKGQWVEAAESLIMCARTISDSIPHLRHVWRPSRFALWSDSRRSLWLSTVGQEVDNPEKGNEQVMSFADDFLEPDQLGVTNKKPAVAKLAQPTVSGMCTLLTSLTKEAVSLYLREHGMDYLAYSRLESLLKLLMATLDAGGIIDSGSTRTRSGRSVFHKQHVAEEASLRKVIASISHDMTKLAERLLLLVEDDDSASQSSKKSTSTKEQGRPYFVRVVLSGKTPIRFLESTTLPAFLEQDTPCICRVPKEIVDSALSAASSKQGDNLEELMCSAYGKPIRDSLLRDDSEASIVFYAGNLSRRSDAIHGENDICVSIGFVEMENSEFDNVNAKHFVYEKVNTADSKDTATPKAFVKVTVANPFPCPLSRQRTLLTTELMSA